MTGDGPLTVGVEEEFSGVDPATGRLANGAERILGHLDDRDACSFASEIRATMVETATAVCDTLDTVRARLVESRRAVVAAAEATGLAVVAAGSPPLGGWDEAEVTASPRYQQILELHQQVVREQIVCGCHVHVGIADRDLAVEVLARVRPWLAVLLALSSGSPYWNGADTGYASYRTTVWGRWPAADVPEAFASADEYDAVVAALIDTGTIVDAAQVYWDVRLSAKQPTVEFRVADVCATVDEAVLQAGLCRALARTAQRAAVRGEPAPAV
ncbi:MAG: YbdK family carboxylate-amine ligase, partial [Actinomycetota bacterium]|nr:YbdK family carboxylate-amine ligase [Actinomycetota bacterium]